ncbi:MULTISPECIES: hypothetical protein [Streptomyces]|uniref:Uncharacterized protein n=1 Tax=Streptomyces lateritius TaxID=67313 RepID=A0ABW6YHD7_9ACTN|nr:MULTISPECIES: hypothetical protein [Streptomyces]
MFRYAFLAARPAVAAVPEAAVVLSVLCPAALCAVALDGARS